MHRRDAARESPRRARPGVVRAHSPTDPSICSRSRSACPLCRAYSSTMWIMIHRREIGPVRRDRLARPGCRRRHDGARHVALRSEQRRCPPSPPPDRRSLKSASGSSSIEIGGGEGLPAKTWSNQCHSTIGHVPHQTEQAERGRRHAAARQCGAVEQLALPEQGRALVVEPRGQHRALVAGRGGIGRVTAGSTDPG